MKKDKKNVLKECKRKQQREKRKKLRHMQKIPLAIFLQTIAILLLSGCIETQKQAELWADINIEYLKTPTTLDLSPNEQKELISRIEAIDLNARGMQKNSEGMMAQYWQINSEFANFLKRKLLVFQSRHGVLMKKNISFDINSSSRNNCIALLAFKPFATELDELATLSNKNNQFINAFIRTYGKNAELNVLRFMTDETAIRATAKKARLLALLGEGCSLYFDSKEFFEKLSIEELDCNTLQIFSEKISKVEELVDSTKKLMNELAAHDIDISMLQRDYANLNNKVSELKQLYADLNYC